MQLRFFLQNNLAGWEKVCTFALALIADKGRLAEGLGTGLQNLLLRFKSGSDLRHRRVSTWRPSFLLVEF